MSSLLYNCNNDPNSRRNRSLVSGRRARFGIAIFALLGASAAMAVPGPATEITGIASVLLLAAVAVLPDTTGPYQWLELLMFC